MGREGAAACACVRFEDISPNGKKGEGERKGPAVEFLKAAAVFCYSFAGTWWESSTPTDRPLLVRKPRKFRKPPPFLSLLSSSTWKDMGWPGRFEGSKSFLRKLDHPVVKESERDSVKVTIMKERFKFFLNDLKKEKKKNSIDRMGFSPFSPSLWKLGKRSRDKKDGGTRGAGNKSIKNLSSVCCPPSPLIGSVARGRIREGRERERRGEGRTGKLRAANYIAFKINY